MCVSFLSFSLFFFLLSAFCIVELSDYLRVMRLLTIEYNYIRVHYTCREAMP